MSSELISIPYDSLVHQIGDMEEQYQVTIVYTTLSDSVDDVNNKLLLQFNRKGIALGKFWLTEEGITKLREGDR